MATVGLDPLLDTAPCGFVSFGDDGRITRVNSTLAGLLGYERDELVGSHVERLFNVGTRVFYQTHLFPLARMHGRAEEIFLMLRSNGGEDVGVFCNIQRREREAGAEYDMVLMRVRERQKYEEELLRARREAEETAAELEATTDELAAANDDLMERTEEATRLREVAEVANRAKTEFLAVMSHELRTPLNAISGYVQLLDMAIKGPVTEGQREILDRIDRSQRHLLRLINDLLNLSKLEAGAVDFDIEDIPVTAIVADVLPMIEPQLAEKDVEFEVEVPQDLAVRADEDKTAQIVLNLLSNAAKFTQEGGRVTLRAGAADDAAGMIFIGVSDTGIGIPADKFDAVFEPFVQVKVDSRRGASHGTGLGLAISRDLARGMGGDIRLESVENEGSTFTLTLPVAAGVAS